MTMKWFPDGEVDILIVDDDPDVRAVLIRTLVQAGTPRGRIEEAGSAEEAVSKCFARSFGCIIADHRMTGRTGVELLGWLHEHHPLAGRALMTGNHDERIAIDAINQGRVDAFIQKPWEEGDVLAAVQKLMRVHRKRVHSERALHQALMLAAKRPQDRPHQRRL